MAVGLKRGSDGLFSTGIEKKALEKEFDFCVVLVSILGARRRIDGGLRVKPVSTAGVVCVFSRRVEIEIFPTLALPPLVCFIGQLESLYKSLRKQS